MNESPQRHSLSCARLQTECRDGPDIRRDTLEQRTFGVLTPGEGVDEDPSNWASSLVCRTDDLRLTEVCVNDREGPRSKFETWPRNLRIDATIDTCRLNVVCI